MRPNDDFSTPNISLVKEFSVHLLVVEESNNLF